MDHDRQIGRNEALFRQVNEAIARGLWPGDEQTVRFRCECGDLDCHEAVEVTGTAYERVRASPLRFIVLPGHEMPDVEAVVEDAGGYLVVEKRGSAGAEAAALDPSS